MTLPIYIPSRSRASVINNGVLRKLPAEQLEHTILVVPQSQRDDYVRALKDKILVVGTEKEGISNVRQYIGELAHAAKEKYFCAIDDDVEQFATRVSEDDWHLRQSTPDDMKEMFAWIEHNLQTYAHVGISARGNNLLRGKDGPVTAPKPLAYENVRTLRLLAYQTDKFLACDHGRVPVMEDFDLLLSLLRKGYKNVMSYWWTQDQRQTSAPGGCSDYRDHKLHEDAARKLAELHPGFVRLRTKTNKSKLTHHNEFQTRTEVTVQWKAAFKSSQS